MTTAPQPHPAKFSKAIIEHVAGKLPTWIDLSDGRRPWVLDSFAGSGKVHLLQDEYQLGVRTVGVELEPEWAAWHQRTVVGDSTNLAAVPGLKALGITPGDIEVLFTSPTYGNRMADHHEAKDPCKACSGTGLAERATANEGAKVCTNCSGSGLSKRHTYKHYLGRMPTEGSSCVMPWGRAYREFHERWMREQLTWLARGALIVLNVKNKADGDDEYRVVEFFINMALVLGCTIIEVDHIGTRGLAHGANHQVRTDGEKIIWLRAPMAAQGRLL